MFVAVRVISAIFWIFWYFFLTEYLETSFKQNFKFLKERETFHPWNLIKNIAFWYKNWFWKYAVFSRFSHLVKVAPTDNALLFS